MREILFRGKEKNSGEWIYGDLRHISDGHGGYILCIVDNTGSKDNKRSDPMAEYKGCLSREQTEQAWHAQKSGKSIVSVAMSFNVDVSTLYRSYQHYGFQPPIYRKGRKGNG